MYLGFTKVDHMVVFDLDIIRSLWEANKVLVDYCLVLIGLFLVIGAIRYARKNRK